MVLRDKMILRAELPYIEVINEVDEIMESD